MIVAIRVDASSKIGTGHVARCLNLARALQMRGHSIYFIARDLLGHRIEFIRSQGFEVEVLSAPGNSASPPCDREYGEWLGVSVSVDVADTKSVLTRRPAAWLVVDHYALDNAWERGVDALGMRILVIDDLADRAHHCSILVDQNASIERQADYRSLLSGQVLGLFGPRYALLGHEYAHLRPLVQRSGRGASRVVISLGGGDVGSLILRLAALLHLAQFSNYHFVVAMTTHQSRASVEAAFSNAPNVSFLFDQPTLASSFMEADLSIGAGGVTMWERCALGLPSFVVAIADNQVEGARLADKLGVAIYLGRFDDEFPKRLVHALSDLDPIVLKEMSQRCLELVDARGADRVARAMENEHRAFSFRPAGEQDEALLLNWANEPLSRAQALDPTPISSDAHRRWFASRLADTVNSRLYIATLENTAAGQVRLERGTKYWTISYALDAQLRGRGLGAKLLKEALSRFREEFPDAGLEGFVKATNPSSLRIFRSLGFAETVGDVHHFTRPVDGAAPQEGRREG